MSKLLPSEAPPSVGAVITLLILVAIAIVVPASSRAATFCVNVSNAAECSGTKAGTIASAISAASVTAGRDTIDIAGGHFYEEPVMIDTVGNPVDIVVVGATAPILSSTTPGATVLTVENETSTLTNLQLSIDGGESTGLVFKGAIAKKITVAGLAAGSNSVGVELRHGALRESTVELAHSATVGTTAVSAGDGTQIEASTLAATQGVMTECCEEHVTISRVKTLAPIGIDDREGGHVLVDDSLLLVSGVVTGKGTSSAIVVADSPGGPSSLEAYNVTAIDVGGSADLGVIAGATGHPEAVTVRDSIIRGFDTDLETSGAGAVIDADYDDYSSAGGTIEAGAHNLDVDPGFVNLPGGDLHLAAGSPLIDRGDPAGTASSVDFYGAPRLSAGLGGLPLLDIGAAEFPSVATVTPPARGPGGGPGGEPERPHEVGVTAAGPPRAPAPALILSSARRRLGPHQTFTYALGCPAGLSGPCEGTLDLSTSGKVKLGKTKGGKASKRVLPIGKERFTIASGSTEQLVVKPDRRSLAVLGKLRKLRLTATASATVADSPVGVSAAKFDLLAPTGATRRAGPRPARPRLTGDGNRWRG